MKLSESIKKIKRNKYSTRSLLTENALKEKSRNILRTNPLYDSFDDNESDKEEEYYGKVLLPNSYHILILDVLLFLSTLYYPFYIPLRMAKGDCFCIEEKILNKLILYLIDALYIFDFCLSFFRAYYNYQLKLVKNNMKII